MNDDYRTNIEDARNYPLTIRVPSRSGGPAHTVTITVSRRAGIAGPAGSRYAVCDCMAGRSFRKCWAVRSVASALLAVAIAR